MNKTGLYLSRQETRHPLLNQPPDPDTAFIVVIPVFNETDPEPCLQSIEEAAGFASQKVEILIVVNDTDKSPETAVRQNRISLES